MVVKKKTTKKKVVSKSSPKKSTTKKKILKKNTLSKPKSSKSSKKAFGGYEISFAGRKETVEQVFGSKPIPPSEMTKKIWAFVKSKNLSNR